MPACAGSACTSTAAAACAWPHRRLQRHGVSLAGTWQGGRLLQCCMLGSRRREHARLLTAAGHTTQTAFAGPSVARRVGRAPVASPAHCTASLPRQRPPWLSTFGSVCVRLCCRSSVHHLWQSTSPPAMPEEDTLHVRFPEHQEHGTDHSACASAEAKLSSFATRAHAHSTKLAGLLRMEERHGTQREPPRQEAPPAHFIAKTAVPACTVVAMAVGCFRRAGVQDTVLCKGNALELLGSMEHGDLESLHEQGAGGLVSALGVLPAEEATDVRSACTCPFALCAAPACLVSCGGAERCLHPREAPRLSVRNSRVAGACRRAARTCSCCCARTRSTTSTSTTTCTGAAVAGRNRSDLERPLAGLLRSAGHFKRLKAAVSQVCAAEEAPGPAARSARACSPVHTTGSVLMPEAAGRLLSRGLRASLRRQPAAAGCGRAGRPGGGRAQLPRARRAALGLQRGHHAAPSV